MTFSIPRRFGMVVACAWAIALVGVAAPLRAPAAVQEAEARPARLSLVEGPVSFWRSGADDWVRARLNTPLTPGDHVYASEAGRFEVQIGAEAFVRGNQDTEIVLERLDPDYVQFRVARGVASVDARDLDPDMTVEIDAPDAAFTIRRSGYYRVDVGDETTVFMARQGGEAEAIVEAGERWRVRSDEQVIVDPSSTPVVQTYLAAELDEWDRWNAQRTNDVVAAPSARYLPRGVYGGETLDRYGTWEEAPVYGRVWYPREVEPQWAPYSHGHWVWDPGFGWTWIDDSPWGWAPSHYGRWVYVEQRWGWAPGPVAVRPFYAPAVVGFLAGPRVTVSIGVGPVGWVALGWGEPIVPWWGHRGFIGRPSWRGWGGPRVVNNVIIHEEHVVHVDRIVYSHTHTRGALMSVPRNRFGEGHVREARMDVERSRFRPLRGALPVRPTARALAPYSGPEDRHVAAPSRRVLDRATVAARHPVDAMKRLGASGVRPARREPAARVIVPKRLSSGIQEASNPAPAPARREPMTGRERREREGAVEGRPERPGGRERMERSRTRNQPPSQDVEAPPDRGGQNEPAVAPPKAGRDVPGAESPRGRRPPGERSERRSAPAAPLPPGVSAPAPDRAPAEQPRREPRPLRPARPDRSEPPPLPPAEMKQPQVEEPRRSQPRERPARPESARERPVRERPQANPPALPPAAPPQPQREIAPKAAEPPPRPQSPSHPQKRRQDLPERYRAPEPQSPRSAPAPERRESMRAPERREQPAPAARQEPRQVRERPERRPAREPQQSMRAPERREPMRAPEAAPRAAPRAPEPRRAEPAPNVSRGAPVERIPQQAAPPQQAPPPQARPHAEGGAAAPHREKGGPHRPQPEH